MKYYTVMVILKKARPGSAVNVDVAMVKEHRVGHFLFVRFILGLVLLPFERLDMQRKN